MAVLKVVLLPFSTYSNVLRKVCSDPTTSSDGRLNFVEASPSARSNAVCVSTASCEH